MSEKPIAFSSPMVLAILNTKPGVWPVEAIDRAKPIKWQTRRCHEKPRYAVADVLWVREALLPFEMLDGCPQDGYAVMYEVDHRSVGGAEWSYYWRWEGKSLPSIFMPKWAARLWLKVKRVWQIELQDISCRETCAEGAAVRGGPTTPESEFRPLWDSLNAKRGYSWESNPLVYVYEFMRVK